jgi:hypothetical protein
VFPISRHSSPRDATTGSKGGTTKSCFGQRRRRRMFPENQVRSQPQQRMHQ